MIEVIAEKGRLHEPNLLYRCLGGGDNCYGRWRSDAIEDHLLVEHGLTMEEYYQVMSKTHFKAVLDKETYDAYEKSAKESQ